MPIYDFHCAACKKDFEHRLSMSERDKKVPCPECGSKKTARKVSAASVGGAGGGGGNSGGGGGCCGGCRCGG